MNKLIDKLRIESFEEQIFDPGHNACPGCGSTMALRQILNIVGPNAIYFVPASCGSLYFAPSDTASAAVPTIHTIFGAGFAQAEGMTYGLKRQGRNEKVAIWAGDGACYDIGLSGLSGIATRGADVLVFCNDNQGFQNTGGHESSATPKETVKHSNTEQLTGPNQRKDLMEIMAAHRVPYIATASPAFPKDLDRKVRKAAEMKGFRLILLLTTCVSWGYDSRYSVKLARLAVETGYFPLYEVEYGTYYTITYEPSMVPFDELADFQKRFKDVDLDSIKREIEQRWTDLRFKAGRDRTEP